MSGGETEKEKEREKERERERVAKTQKFENQASSFVHSRGKGTAPATHLSRETTQSRPVSLKDTGE